MGVATAKGHPEPQQLEEVGRTLPGASGGSEALLHLSFRLWSPDCEE